MQRPFKIDSNQARRNRFMRCCILKHRRIGLHYRRRMIIFPEMLTQIVRHLRPHNEDIGQISVRRRGRPRRSDVDNRNRRIRQRGRSRRTNIVANEANLNEANDITHTTVADPGVQTQVLIANAPAVNLTTTRTRLPRSRTRHEEEGECSYRPKVRQRRPLQNQLGAVASLDPQPMEINNNDLITESSGVHVEGLNSNTTSLSLGSTRNRKYLTPWSFGQPDSLCDFCNAVVWSKESLGRKIKKSRLKFNICCQKGKVKLPLLQDPPDLLKQLLDTNGGKRSREFRRLIRSYNTIYAFTSMGGKVDKAVNNGSGPYCFQLGGQNHHNIGSLLPPEGKQPRFMQLYFHETDKEVSNRINSLDPTGSSELDPDIVEGLYKMIYDHNPLAKVCKMARERIDPSNLHPVQLRLLGNRTKDGRQYNLPTTNELAALIVGVGDNEKGNRDIIIHERSGGLRRISELHPSFMAMQYPLIFPYGEDGYRTNIKHNDAETTTRRKKKTVSMREYYAYRFMERRKEDIYNIRSGKPKHKRGRPSNTN